MKRFASTLVAIILVTQLECGEGFQTSIIPFHRAFSTTESRIQLYGMFDFKPFHGQGSGETQSNLDEQWEAQQEILRARRGQLTKDNLKQKYAKGAAPKGDAFAGKGGGKLKMDEMWIDESPRKSKKAANNLGKNKVKFFWEK